MELIADIFLVAGALGAGLYCFILARRLKRFTDLEKGVGGAVSVLSAQADELRKSLDTARQASDHSGDALRELTQKAETVAQRLELMMASMHDVIPQKEEVPKAERIAEPHVEPDAPEEPQEAVGEADELENDNEPPIEPGAPEPEAAKPPEGLMFFRHSRARTGATQ